MTRDAFVTVVFIALVWLFFVIVPWLTGRTHWWEGKGRPTRTIDRHQQPEEYWSDIGCSVILAFVLTAGAIMYALSS